MIMLGANDCKQHKLLFELLDEPGIAARNDWNSRLDHSAEEKQVLAERVQARPAQEWEAHLQAGRVPAGRVRRLSEALADPQLETRDVLHVPAAAGGLPRDRKRGE